MIAMVTLWSTRTLAESMLENATMDAVALSDGDNHLTYAEVDRWSNRVARALLLMGIKPSFPVGMVFRTSAIAVVVECALHKIGSPVVPVPSAKAAPQRRNHPAYSTMARAVITTTAGLDWIPDAIPAVALDTADLQRLIAGVSDAPITQADFDGMRSVA